MAEAGQAPKKAGKTYPIDIKNDNGVSSPITNVIVGDIVEFHNEASSTKIVQFTDENGPLPIALEIPAGGKAEFVATVAGTLDYSIIDGTSAKEEFEPADDDYQVIVGSGNLDI